MQTRNVIGGLMRGAAIAALAVAATGPAAVRAQQGGAASSTALSGVVGSQEEGRMEGVVVTARRDAANVDVSVVSDASGAYTFPRSHLQPGTYTLRMRAVGYDLVDPGSVVITADKPATRDLKLEKTKDITRQLTSVEWLMSVKGTDEQKALIQRQMLTCTYCHNLELPIKSKHTAEEFPAVITRMLKYYADGTSYGFHDGRGRRIVNAPQSMAGAEKNPGWGIWPGTTKVDIGKYLATINQSGGKTLPSEFKTLPRPKGKATRVIITQYDMPRRDTHPHDSDLDSKGRLWYTDQSAPYFGMFDPKTATFTEYNAPVSTNHFVTGGSDVQVDNDDNVWFPLTHDSVRGQFGLLHKFDVKTQKLIPSKMDKGAGPQFLAKGPDGKIWLGFGEFMRVDPKTMAVDWRFNWAQSPEVPKGLSTIGYEMAVDGQGNPWMLGYAASGLWKVDVKTKTLKFYPTPTPNSGPRRGVFDADGRLFFSEYTGDGIGMYDPKTDTITEFNSGIKWFGTYTASNVDKFGRVYGSSNTSDRLMRADTRTGEVVNYLMPTMDFDAKQIRIDPISKTTVWFTNVRAARVMKIEPLE